MERQRPCAFPLLVRGDWGPAEPPPALRKKLLCYFQSQKRSGGGECELRAGTGTGRILVCFARPEVKQRVLARQSHQLHLGGEEKLRLIVTEPETALATEEETFEEKSVPTKALDAMSNLQTKDDTKASKKAESFVPNRQRQEEVDSAEATPSVVFENIQTCSPNCLQMLLENISGLTVDADFTVELIPEINVAVATFIKSIDTKEFVKKCSQDKRVRGFKMTARLLELTQTIKAENLPDIISTGYLTVYFESERSGGGPVSDVQLFPKENSALITFCDHKDLTKVLEKQHLLEQTLISVHPYYHSLGMALYGKERPAVKMPDPIGVPLDPYVWQFLQRHANLTQDISQEMAVCHCELKWPQADCADPEVMLCPSPSLCKQKKPMIKLLKTWQQDASTEFSRIMARYIAIKCKVNSSGWEDVKNRLLKDGALIITDISEEMVVIAGNRTAVDSAEKEVRECMKQSEREKQSIEISVSVILAKYAVLHNAGLEENIQKEYPCLKIFYDDKKKTVQLCGLPAEVYKIKADLLEKVLSIPCTSVTIDPHVFHYLRCVDNKKMSDMLFIKEKINTFYELQDDTVLLYGDTPKDLLEAEKQIKTGLKYECINVEDAEVLKKDQWRNLLSLLKTYNSSQEIVITWQSVGKESKMIIAGFSKAVTEVYQRLNDFVDRNTIMERVILANSVVIVQFVEREKSGVCEELKKKGVTVRFDTKIPCISLRGPRTEVPEAFTMFENFVSSLYSKNVPVDKPGAKEFFTERKDLCILEAKQQFSCFIRIKEEEEEQKGGEVGDKVKRKVYYEENLVGGIVVGVYKGNLCNYPVDVVVNASNENLKHIGGLADALSRAAGPALQEECDELVKKHGNLEPGCAVITGAGKLPCKNVIHAVGPRWSKEESQKCTWLLKKTVKKCLQLAEIYNHRSIALPAISGGIFGFPLGPCTYSIVSSIKETLEESRGNSSLKEVHLVAFAQDNIQAFSNAFRKVFSDFSPSSMSLHQASTVPQPRQKKISQHVKNSSFITTEEGLNVVLQTGSIEDATTSVVVVSVGRDLQLDKGPLGRALLSKAGPMLQIGLRKEGGGRTPEEGSVLKTKGYNLACSVVLHAVLPMWSQKDTPSKVLGDIITKCLEIAEELSLKSITFPAIGTGKLEFPRSVVAKLLFDKVFEFSKNRVNSLEEVHILLHPKDTANVLEFSNELENRSAAVKVQKPSPNEASQSIAFSAISSTSAHNVLEVTIGSIVFQVAEGDITKEEADVIVNITNQTFSLKIGVSRAILNGAGKAVEDECGVLARQTNKNYIITQAGNLPCKKIIHFVAQNDIKLVVSQVLQECELQQYTSVAFPAIGTGEAGRNPAEVADNMIDAVTDFARWNSAPSLKTVKVVIFQPHLMSVFHASMQKREKSPATLFKSLVSKAYHMTRSLWNSEKRPPKEKAKVVLEKKIDLAVVQICGENKKEVEEAEEWLRSAISKEQFQTEIVDECISHFGEEESKELDDLEAKLKIVFHLKSTSIEISGVTKDVCMASVAVHKMILRVKAANEKEIQAELLQNLIEWKYSEKGSYVPFNSLTNAELENAYTRKQKIIEVTIGERIYTVDMERKTAVDAQGRETSIIRVDKSEDQKSTMLPPTWDPMENEQPKIVELKPNSREYKSVQERFLRTCQSFKIEKIERVQNPYFWKAYQIKKCEMDKKNGSRKNEKKLFHGTSKESLTFINKHGFNRSYAGMHAANFGNGTYFAVNASYSAHDTYSKPDVNGRKYMYLARVLVGEYSQGVRGAITPSPKNAGNSVDLFDSSTDNVSQPSMFIIFNDIQAYPEYLITFTR